MGYFSFNAASFLPSSPVKEANGSWVNESQDKLRKITAYICLKRQIYHLISERTKTIFTV